MADSMTSGRRSNIDIVYAVLSMYDKSAPKKTPSCMELSLATTNFAGILLSSPLLERLYSAG